MRLRVCILQVRSRLSSLVYHRLSSVKCQVQPLALIQEPHINQSKLDQVLVINEMLGDNKRQTNEIKTRPIVSSHFDLIWLGRAVSMTNLQSCRVSSGSGS